MTHRTLKFRLTYEGELASTRSRRDEGLSTSRAAHKHEIRRHFHPQLRRLWTEHPALKGRMGPPPAVPEHRPQVERIADGYASAGFRWVPLVRSNDYKYCSLHILYLRSGSAGSVISSSDIDNRIKTLLDALKLPDAGEIPSGTVSQNDEDPFFVLLNDDKLVTQLYIDTDRLLSPTGGVAPETDARLVITVEASM